MAISTPLYRTMRSNKPPLRVGVMLDDWTVPAWIAAVLRSVQCSGIAELTTAILNCEPTPARRSWGERLQRVLTGSFSTLLWRLYVRVDERLRREFGTPFRPINVHSLLAGAKLIAVRPLSQGRVHRFSAADTAAVKRDGLDVILHFGCNAVRGEILSAAKYGVWSYHHGDNTQYRGGPPGFWEMYERNPITGTTLQVLNEERDGGHVIYRSYGATQSFESLLVNRYLHYWKAIPFVARCLRRIYEQGPTGMRLEEETPVDTRRLYSTPGNGRMLLFLTRVACKMIFVRIQDRLGIQGNHWFVGVARGVAPHQQLAGKVTPLHPPAGRLWADPMLVRKNGRAFMFFEDYDYGLRRARISVVELAASGCVGAPRPALEADHHISYPFVFEWRGDHFMVCETASVQAVRLYRAVEFPTRWEYVQDLLSGIKAADATICEHRGRWYLFTSVSETGGSSWDELFLFVSDTPIGPWSPHPMNPIVSDVRSARPGGALFRRDGVLYRPAQNSDKTYGHSLAILEVTELTPDRYAERLAYRIEPDWLPRIYGCHTISMAGDLMALDCKTVKWRPYAAGRCVVPSAIGQRAPFPHYAHRSGREDPSPHSGFRDALAAMARRNGSRTRAAPQEKRGAERKSWDDRKRV
jgi:hypothetical protein